MLLKKISINLLKTELAERNQTQKLKKGRCEGHRGNNLKVSVTKHILNIQKNDPRRRGLP